MQERAGPGYEFLRNRDLVMKASMASRDPLVHYRPVQRTVSFPRVQPSSQAL